MKLLNLDQFKYLKKISQRGKLSHSLLFLGSKGTAKEIVALNFAKFLNCHYKNICGKCISCLSFEKGHHPDFLKILPVGEAIRISQIKETIPFLFKAPFFKRYKILFIKDAEKMTFDAASFLLKILEEPPQNSFLILTSLNEHFLPQTIVSRVQIIRFPPLSKRKIKEILKEEGFSPDKIEEILEFSEGKIERAITFLKNPSLLEKEKEFLEKISFPLSLSEKISLLEEFMKKIDLEQLIDVLKAHFEKNFIQNWQRLENLEKLSNFAQKKSISQRSSLLYLALKVL